MPNLVAINVYDPLQFIECLKAVLGSGHGAFIIDTRLNDKRREQLIEIFKPTHVMTSPTEVSKCDGGVGILEGDVIVIPTSGTTGQLKAAILTHDALEASIKATHDYLKVNKELDAWLCLLPLGHIGGLMVLLRSLFSKMKYQVIEHANYGTIKEANLKGANLTALVPTLLDRVDYQSWKAILVGAMPTNKTLPRNLIKTYGMTETSSGVVYNGTPIGDTEILIEETTQEILIRTSSLLRAYRIPETKEKPRKNEIDPKLKNGFFPTGDAGYFDSEGKLVVRGRLFDVVNTGGEKVFPSEIEPYLLKITGIKDVVVTKVDHPKWGEALTALIVTEDNSPKIDRETLKRELKNDLQPWEIPQLIFQLDQLPKTSMGKVSRSDAKLLAEKLATDLF